MNSPRPVPPPPDPQNCVPIAREWQTGEIAKMAHDAMNQALKRGLLKQESLSQSCLNCLHFNETDEVCRVWNARPPARIIAFSCGTAYEDRDDIPF